MTPEQEAKFLEELTKNTAFRIKWEQRGIAVLWIMSTIAATVTFFLFVIDWIMKHRGI